MEYEGASFERKFAGWLIDKVVSLLFLILYWVLFLNFGSKEITIMLYWLFSVVLAYFTYIFLGIIFMKASGSSLGMLFSGIKAIHFSSPRLSWRECLIREILSGLTVFAIANAVYMLAAHTERSAIDQLTESYIVRR